MEGRRLSKAVQSMSKASKSAKKHVTSPQSPFQAIFILPNFTTSRPCRPLSTGQQVTTTKIQKDIKSDVNDYYYYNHFTAPCLGLPGCAGTRRNIHPLTYPDHQPYFISFFCLLGSIASSIYTLDNLSTQPLSKSSLVYLLVWSPPPHVPYISSPN